MQHPTQPSHARALPLPRHCPHLRAAARGSASPPPPHAARSSESTPGSGRSHLPLVRRRPLASPHACRGVHTQAARVTRLATVLQEGARHAAPSTAGSPRAAPEHPLAAAQVAPRPAPSEARCESDAPEVHHLRLQLTALRRVRGRGAWSASSPAKKRQMRRRVHLRVLSSPLVAATAAPRGW